MRLATLDAAMRRGWVWPMRPPPLARPRPSASGDLGQLRGLAGAGSPADDHHLVLAQRLGDVLAPAETGSDSGKVMGGSGVAGARAGGSARGRAGFGAAGVRGAGAGAGVRVDEFTRRGLSAEGNPPSGTMRA
jgi:hypothetical protein